MDLDKVEQLKSSPLFDVEWYRSNAQGLRLYGLDPIYHYLTIGWMEGRNPCKFFYGDWYLATNLDVAAARINPLLHYINSGEAEGRWPCRVFHPAWYSEEYGVPLGEGRALAHYLTVGWKLGLKPNEIFDPAFYAATHADIIESGVDAVVHYLAQGFREGREVAPGVALDSYRDRYLGGETSIDPIHHYLSFGKKQGWCFSSAKEPPSIAREIRTFTSTGPDFEEFDPEILAGTTPAAKLIAFYLPQYHQIPENDAWWGKGFTEWRNTQRGVPRFVGHHQPRVPRDLGFYDLTSPGVFERQIQLARQAGLHGFCFYYYNFDGKRMLERPVEQFLADPSLDFPFCIMWANENWTRRWDGLERDVLLQQSYRLEDEDALLAEWCRHFSDPRYIKAVGRPIFLIYRPANIPDAPEVIARWRQKLATEHGQHPWMLMSQSFGDSDAARFNLDGAFEFPPHKLAEGLPSINIQLTRLDPNFSGTVVSYDEVVDRSLSAPTPPFPLIKTACPGWDNDCRRQGAGFTLHGSSPRAYERWLAHLADHAIANPFAGEPFIFVNAWNEWAEAAYLEPDVHYGAAYLNATARALSQRRETVPKRSGVLLVGHDAHCHGAQLNLLHLGRTLSRRFGLSVTWLLLEGGALLDSYRELGPVTVARPGSAELSKLTGTLRTEGVHYAVTNTLVTGGVVPQLREAGFRIVSLVHELPNLAAEYKLESEAKAIADGSHAIVFAANMVRHGFREFAGEPQGSMHILPQGLYVDMRDEPDARAIVRAELGLAPESKIVLGVGFGDLRKGVDLFLHTAALAANRDPDVAFLWVGGLHQIVDQWLLSRNHQDAPTNFRHLAFTDSIAKYYRAADALFLSSREDPFPSIVLEALACGLPVVGFEGRTGTEDLIREHGSIVPAFDFEAAFDALRRLMTLPAEAATEAADLRRETVRRDFDYDRFAFRLLQLLDPRLRSISVVVPNYNYGRYLEQRLRSICAQTVPIFEIIVLDDASTDDSMAMIERLREKFNRDFTVIGNATNTGSSIRQWLKGIEQASGELIWVAEADDDADPTFLERLLAHFENDRTLFAFSDSVQIDSDGARIGNSYQFYYKDSDAEDLCYDLVIDARSFAQRFLSVRNLILNVSAVLARREVFLDALRENLSHLKGYSFAGDWHLYASICLREGDVAYVAEPLNTHRRHQNSATHVTKGMSHIAEVERVHAFLEEVYGTDEQLRARRQSYIALLREQFGLSRAADSSSVEAALIAAGQDDTSKSLRRAG